MTAYRLDHAAGRSNVGVPVASAVTISPRGEVFDEPRTTEPGPTGERAIMVWHDNVVDEALAAFLVHRGYGGRLRPMSEQDQASPRVDSQRVATPQFIRDWYAAEIQAGRIVPPEHLPPVAVRKALRETQGLARPAVAAQLGVSVDAVRLWETGEREPQGDNRTRYHDLLGSWQSGPQVPAEPRAEDEPEPEPQAVCNVGGWCSLHGRQHGPVSLAAQRAARAAAYAAQRERVAQANALALARRVTGR